MHRSSQIIILGSGLAALMSALVLTQRGHRVTLVANEHPYQSEDNNITSGMRYLSALEGDGVDRFFVETLLNGDLLSNQELVKSLCQLWPTVMDILLRLRVPFEQNTEGSLQTFFSERSSFKRVIQNGTRTATTILQSLYTQVLRAEEESKVQIELDWEFLAPIENADGQVVGATCLHKYTNEIRHFVGHALIVASGGSASLLESPQQNQLSQAALLAQLYKSGVTFSNLEFIHSEPACVSLPTRLFPLPGKIKAATNFWFEVEGDNKKYDLKNFFPDIHKRSLTPPFLKTFYGLQQKHKEKKINFYADLSPHQNELKSELKNSEAQKVQLQTAALNSLGGIYVNEALKSNKDGLFVAGDAVGNIHGANCLTDSIIYFHLATAIKSALSVDQYVENTSIRNADTLLLEEKITVEFEINKKAITASGFENATQLFDELISENKKSLIPFKWNQQLQVSYYKLLELKERTAHIRMSDNSRVANRELLLVRQLPSLIDLSLATLKSCLARNESRGGFIKPEILKMDSENFNKISKVIYASEPQIFYEDITYSFIKPTDVGGNYGAPKNVTRLIA